MMGPLATGRFAATDRRKFNPMSAIENETPNVVGIRDGSPIAQDAAEQPKVTGVVVDYNSELYPAGCRTYLPQAHGLMDLLSRPQSAPASSAVTPFPAIAVLPPV